MVYNIEDAILKPVSSRVKN